MLKCLRQNELEQTNKATITTFYEKSAGEWAPVLQAVVANEIWLVISDPLIVEAMYTTKNKFFNKSPMMRELLFCLTGDSILFSETSAEWRARRKTLSPAFYKGKLIQMVEIARESVRFTLEHLK